MRCFLLLVKPTLSTKWFCWLMKIVISVHFHFTIRSVVSTGSYSASWCLIQTGTYTKYCYPNNSLIKLWTYLQYNHTLTSNATGMPAGWIRDDAWEPIFFSNSWSYDTPRRCMQLEKLPQYYWTTMVKVYLIFTIKICLRDNVKK